VVDPIMQAAERGSHCSAPILCGPFGVVAMTRRRLVRSVVRLDLSRMLARERLVAAGLVGGGRPLYAERTAYHAEVERSLTNTKVLGSDVGSATPNARGARGGNFKLPTALQLPRWDI